jgi:plasmid stabilization system protein ParE
MPQRLVSDIHADLDVEHAFEWYERQQSELGLEFLDELRGSYDRIADNPLKYQELRSGIRRALLRRFPYAVYFAIEDAVVVILAVLHVGRDPAEWQRRGG